VVFGLNGGSFGGSGNKKKGHPVGWPEFSLRAHTLNTSRGDTEAYEGEYTKKMPLNPQPFIFSDSRLDKIQQRISLVRLKPYLQLANNDRKLAIMFYEWNTSLSESFHGVLLGFEVALRNAFHDVLTDAFLRNDWYDAISWRVPEENNLQAAKGRLTTNGKKLTPDGVVSELYLGFWVSLTNSHYNQTLWDSYLHGAFRHNMKRNTVTSALSVIRNLRNRVAHHEIIVGRKLKEDYSLIIKFISWICPDTAKWIGSNSTFLERYERRPQLPAVLPSQIPTPALDKTGKDNPPVASD
jgi:hypothetical protein